MTNVDIAKVMKNVVGAKKLGALKLSVFRQARRGASYNPAGIRRPNSVSSMQSSHGGQGGLAAKTLFEGKGRKI